MREYVRSLWLRDIAQYVRCYSYSAEETDMVENLEFKRKSLWVCIVIIVTIIIFLLGTESISQYAHVHIAGEVSVRWMARALSLSFIQSDHCAYFGVFAIILSNRAQQWIVHTTTQTCVRLSKCVLSFVHLLSLSLFGDEGPLMIFLC